MLSKSKKLTWARNRDKGKKTWNKALRTNTQPKQALLQAMEAHSNQNGFMNAGHNSGDSPAGSNNNEGNAGKVNADSRPTKPISPYTSQDEEKLCNKDLDIHAAPQPRDWSVHSSNPDSHQLGDGDMIERQKNMDGSSQDGISKEMHAVHFNHLQSSSNPHGSGGMSPQMTTLSPNKQAEAVKKASTAAQRKMTRP